ncbi:MAG: precorrin-4 C(11)-methyltransferase [Methylococcaceae bacterium]|nr:MAG: precorrin-4 C(11)-methyltransferase [Methylococcaceae bacterium]
MTVYFIGAGPGAADLITLRGMRLLQQAPLVLYAGSLVAQEMLQYCHAGAEIIDTAGLDLDQQTGHYRRAKANGWDVARLHSGDPALYGATAEQMRRLKALGIAYQVVPGVSSYSAAAAALGSELTKPGVAQTVILTRSEGRSSPMPDGESLDSLAAHGTTLCLFLSGAKLKQTVETLLPRYGADAPVALLRRVSWPDQQIYRGVLGRLLHEVEGKDWRLTTLLLVGPVLADESGDDSRLYAADYVHAFRRARDE